MNYYEIGQRIRKFRKARNLSQEQLAELIEISTTHMSHIETGNTKLSLPVFVNIANVLSVQTDELLYDPPHAKSTIINQELSSILNSCSTYEMDIILNVIKSLKTSLEMYNIHCSNID